MHKENFITRLMLKKNTSRLVFLVVGVFSFTLVSAAWMQMSARYLTASLQAKPVVLSVTMLAQSRATSCGEAAIAMAYNYAYPQTTLNEQTVIEYATSQGYFTEAVSPYTSPVNMVNIAENYAKNISTGMVNTSNGGLALLLKKLQLGEPVIIDVLSNFTNPTSEAHFIVVTGMSVDPSLGNVLVIHYNDPFTGKAEITAHRQSRNHRVGW